MAKAPKTAKPKAEPKPAKAGPALPTVAGVVDANGNAIVFQR